MLNLIFIVLIVGSVLFAAFNGTMAEVMDAGVVGANAAVEIAIGLLGLMALWLGLFRVLRDGGFLAFFARLVQPITRRLFPEIPADHPAMAAMMMNVAANMLGLVNAATPFGLKAMQELKKLNTRPGVATNSMALFLAMNTSGVAVLPLGAISVRASVGSLDPAGIMLPTMLATASSTIVGVTVALLLQRRARFAPDRYPTVTEDGVAGDFIKGLDEAESIAKIQKATSASGKVLLVLFLALIAVGIGSEFRSGDTDIEIWEFARSILASWLLPVLMAAIVLVGVGRRVNVYSSVVSGAKEGFQIMVLIIPYLVAILVAVGMFRASGALEFMAGWLTDLTAVPAEGFLVAFIRPLSGAGAFAVMTEAMTANGPDSYTGYLVSTMTGSTDTTFYILAVYFGSVAVRAVRHTLIACLAADFTGFLAALFWCSVFFG